MNPPSEKNNEVEAIIHAIVCREYGDPNVMQSMEIPRPDPTALEVLIKADAIGVNYVDTMRRSGRHPSAPALPFTPGIEVCGRIAAVGSEVTRFQEGDRVIGRCVTHGAYAEYVCLEERFAVECPDELSDQQGAALFVNAQTAYHALVTMGATQPGENVLITAAAGGVGSCAVQIAKLLGATVIAAASSPDKRSLAQDLGADILIDYTQADWPQQVLDATNGVGANLIIESVGGEIAASSIDCWAAGGRMVIFGQASGTPAPIAGNHLLFGNRAVFGLAVGVVIEDEKVMRAAMEQLNGWLRTGDLQLTIGTSYALKDAALAHRDLEGRATQGKLVLLP
jgi:NADPH2:quinone reductase